MRILHLNPFFFPYAGGIERRILEAGRRLARRHDVVVLTSRLPGTPPEAMMQGVRVVRLDSRYWLGRFYNPPLVSTPGIPEAIQRIDPDVVDFHYRWSPSYARAFQRAHAARVFTFHNTYGEGAGVLRLLSRINDRRARRYIEPSDRILCISQFILDDLRRRGFPSDRLGLSPNGIDAEALRGQAAPGPEDAARRIVAVGRLVRTKGFDLIVRALPMMDASIRLTICGEGPQRSPLLRLARRLGVADRVELPGWVPEPEKLGLLSRCLAFVTPARFESFGMAPLEALAMGAPIVATRTGGLPEVVGGAGLYVPNEDPNAVAQAVNRLHREPDTRQRLVAATRAQTDRFAWDRVLEDLEAGYEAARRVAKL